MPRLVRALPKYRKHRASGQAVVTLGGRDHYLGPHGTKASQVMYDRLIAEWLANGRTAAIPAEDLTVVEVSCRYLEYAKSYYRKNGRCTGVVPAIKATLKYLTAWYGREPAVEFGPVGLKALRQKMVDDGHSRRYINDHVERIKRMFKWAASEQLVPESTYRALSLVEGLRRGRTEARETPPVRPVDDGDIESTLAQLPPVVADMVRLQRLTGMRPNEVCILRPRDLDRSSEVWHYRPAAHKTEHHGRERVVPLGPKSQALLLEYLEREPSEYCFRPCDSERQRREMLNGRRSTPLGRGNQPGTNRKPNPKWRAGECYSTDSYRRAIHRACKSAGVEKWSPNRLRHTAATEIRKLGGLEAAQIMLGHAHADVTQIYAERDLGKADAVALLLG